MALFSTAEPRPLARAVVYAVVLTIPALAIERGAMARGDRFPINEHSKASLDLALNTAFCRRPALRSATFAPARYLAEHPDALQATPRELIGRSGTTVDAYCATVTEAITNNENSLMLMELATWLVRPSTSTASVERVLALVRVGSVAAFAVACLGAGASVALAWIAIWGALAILQLIGSWQQYTVYPFLLTMPLLWIAVCSMAYNPIRAGGTLKRVGVSLAVGLVAGFGSNLRSSYAPMFVIVFAMTLIACGRQWADDRGVARAWGTVATVVGAFVIGWTTFNIVVMRPLEHPAGAQTTNYTYHTIAHPLVMSLAVPRNPLSESEGIRWNDMAAWEIAQRVQPGVAYLGPEYQAALYQYYFGLWRTRPRVMVATYWTKLLRTGRGVFLFASELIPPWRPLRRVYLVWADRVNGAELLALAILLTLFTTRLLWQRVTAVIVLIAGVSWTVTSLLLESALIYSEFNLLYHTYLLFVVLIAPAAIVQIVWDRVRRVPVP